MCKAYLEILRPLNCLMIAIAVLIGGLLVLKLNIFAFFPIYLAMVSAFLIAGAGNVINDFVDLGADRINRPKRAIPSGRISARGALLYSEALFFIGIIIASMINPVALLIAIINVVLLALYSFKSQNKFLAGNLTVAWLVGSSFLFGGAAVGSLLLPAWFALLAGLATVSREIVKDFEDFEGDRKTFLNKLRSKIKVLGLKVGERFGVNSEGTVFLKYRSALFANAVIFLVAAVAISPLPYILGLVSRNYLFALALADIVFLGCAVQVARKKNWSKISMWIKVGMLLGLVAFIAGIF